MNNQGQSITAGLDSVGRLAFEQMLVELLANYATVQPEEVVDEIEKSLARLTVFLTGGYAAMKDARNSIDVIAGLRYFRMHARTSWQPSAVVAGPGGSAAFTRTGVADKADDLWTGIIGVKGRVKLGNGNWFAKLCRHRQRILLNDLAVHRRRGLCVQVGRCAARLPRPAYNVGGRNLIDGLTASGLSIGARFRF